MASRDGSPTIGKCILIVDDDDALRQSLAEQLELYEEFEIGDAPTGGDALQAVKAQRYDIVLLDVGLPDIDGSEFRWSDAASAAAH